MMTDDQFLDTVKAMPLPDRLRRVLDHVDGLVETSEEVARGLRQTRQILADTLWRLDNPDQGDPPSDVVDPIPF